MEKPILQVKGLSTEFRTVDGVVRAVDGVDFELYAGETLGIVGESGCGKSVTSLSVMGLLPKGVGYVAEGEIIFDGRDLRGLPEKEMLQLRGRDMAMIFQEPMTSLNPVYTIGFQLCEVLIDHQGMKKKDAMERAKELLADVGIYKPEEIVKRYPHELSGGMLQRVMIAMGLSCNPKLLIADEPTTALDVTIQAQVLELMKGLKKLYNMAMIMITHDLGIVAETCDQVAVMYAGRIVEKGTLEDVFNHTRHPYTEGLFNSLPNINQRVDELTPIPGMMPDPTNLPRGCAFAPRCRYATEACLEKQPETRSFSDTHTAACTAYEKEGFHLERRDR